MTRYLLDTHTFLWILFSPEKLGNEARSRILDTSKTVFVSSITFWEISLKYALGKLSLTNVSPEDLPPAAVDTGLDILEASAADMASFYRLPIRAHKDPFDRLIAWLAIRNQVVLLTHDPAFKEYEPLGLRVCW